MSRLDLRDVEGNAIPVLVYVRPNGEKREEAISSHDDAVLAKAQDIFDNGFTITLEYLGAMYSMTISDSDGDYYTEIVTKNGNVAMEKMIREFDIQDAIMKREENDQV